MRRGVRGRLRERVRELIAENAPEPETAGEMIRIRIEVRNADLEGVDLERLERSLEAELRAYLEADARRMVEPYDDVRAEALEGILGRNAE